ncbi:MAG: membrane dipeptidase [Herpetosiphonaceae bacterium]|nr:membrane dipeptidase [Herpetosiphonaceae bacterium]
MQEAAPLVDAHLDLAFNAVEGYDPRLPLEQARSSRFGQAAAARGMLPMVSLPALRDAGVKIVFGTLFAMPVGANTDLKGRVYTTAAQAHALADEQLSYYRQLAAEGEITLVKSQADLETVLHAVPDQAERSMLGLVTLMEGADPIREASEVAAWYAAGVRLVGPAWGATRYSGGTHAPGALTPAGRELLHEMGRCGMALDVSHMAEASFWEALDLHRGALCASHSNCRALVPTDRQLSDAMIRAIVERDGVIGTVLFNRFLRPDWQPGDAKAAVTLTDVVRHLEHICTVAGDTAHVGIGSDLDGGFGLEGSPAELDSYAGVPQLGQALAAAGWRPDEVAGLLGGNWLRWLAHALPA